MSPPPEFDPRTVASLYTDNATRRTKRSRKHLYFRPTQPPLTLHFSIRKEIILRYFVAVGIFQGHSRQERGFAVLGKKLPVMNDYRN
jgi:hypothetical protein